jgi:Cysteine rich repeat
MPRAILIAVLLCACETAFAQQFTTEQRDACMGDYQKYCKGTTPGGGRIIACLARSNDKLTAECKKVVAEAQKK